jgi:hypothetical protein
MIEISDKGKILILLVVVVVVIIFFMNFSSSNHNEGMETVQNQRSEEVHSSMTESESSLPHDMESRMSESESVRSESSDICAGETEESCRLKHKMLSRDSVVSGGYKSASYRDGLRGGRSDCLDKFFEEGDPFGSGVSEFAGRDETNGQFAGYVPGKKQKLSEEEKFNSTALLPEEDTKGYFDDVYTTSVKNRHLINVYRPVGVNTISTSNRGRTRDIRGQPINPRNNVSPWNMSSWEPDINIREGALC